jgi:hypothetical protein
VELLIHIGPHKTGTTSLQQSLLQRYGAHKPQKIWYPTPEKNGPGHAELAWSFYQNADPTSNQLLAKLLDAGLKNGCEKIIISAEDFSHLEDSSIFRLKRDLKGLVIHLLVTLTPLRKRLTSTWQEMVKHGYDGTIENFLDSLKEFKQFQADLVERWVRILMPEKTSVVHIDNSSAPEKLFKDVSACTGLEIDGTKASMNQSLGNIETKALRFLNHLNLTKYNHRTRKLLIRLFQSKAWRLCIPIKKIIIPKSHESLVSQLDLNSNQSLTSIHINRIPVKKDTHLRAA